MFPWGWGTTKDQGTAFQCFAPAQNGVSTIFCVGKTSKIRFLCLSLFTNPTEMFATQAKVCWSMIDLISKLIKVSFLSFQTTFDQLYVDNTHSSIIMHVSNKCLKYILKKVWNDERNKNIIVTLMYQYRYLSRG